MILKHKEDPFTFQGKNKKDEYFEGWYFKHVSADLKRIISFIPGISKGKDSHAFIQVIISCSNDDNNIINTYYYRFPIESFSCSRDPFNLVINGNKFSNEGIELNLKNREISIQATIKFSEFVPIKRNILSPNAMGCFAYIPFMQCNHDIISMNHNINGYVAIDNRIIDFKHGKGYIEKDWGLSFPKEYIWLQSNHFKDNSASIMFSLAHIPFMGTEFQGFICNITFKEEEHRFATYNNSRVDKLIYSENLLEIVVTKRAYKLFIHVNLNEHSGSLKAPINGDMNNIIKEGLSGRAHIRLLKNSNILFEDTGSPCAIEIHK